MIYLKVLGQTDEKDINIMCPTIKDAATYLLSMNPADWIMTSQYVDYGVPKEKYSIYIACNPNYEVDII